MTFDLCMSLFFVLVAAVAAWLLWDASFESVR